MGQLPSLLHVTRLKDFAHIYGVRDNQLIGYGLVVELFGDTPRDFIAILQAIKAAGALQAELEII